MLPSQRVQRKTSCAFGEDDLIQCDVAFQNESVGFNLSGSRLPKVQRASNVSSPIKILRSRVAQVDSLGIDGSTSTPLGFVVDNRSTV